MILGQNYKHWGCNNRPTCESGRFSAYSETNTTSSWWSVCAKPAETAAADSPCRVLRGHLFDFSSFSFRAELIWLHVCDRAVWADRLRGETADVSDINWQRQHQLLSNGWAGRTTESCGNRLVLSLQSNRFNTAPSLLCAPVFNSPGPPPPPRSKITLHCSPVPSCEFHKFSE